VTMGPFAWSVSVDLHKKHPQSRPTAAGIYSINCPVVMLSKTHSSYAAAGDAALQATHGSVIDPSASLGVTIEIEPMAQERPDRSCCSRGRYAGARGCGGGWCMSRLLMDMQRLACLLLRLSVCQVHAHRAWHRGGERVEGSHGYSPRRRRTVVQMFQNVLASAARLRETCAFLHRSVAQMRLCCWHDACLLAVPLSPLRRVMLRSAKWANCCKTRA
jgi:hypothetical protein